MELRKFVACTACAATLTLAAGCADGTGQALTPTLPTVDTATVNADGTRLKASAPQPLSPRSAIRVANLTPQLVIENGTSTFTPSDGLSYVFEVFEVDGSGVVAKSDPIPAGSPQTTWDVPADALKTNKTYAWHAYAIYSNVPGSTSDVVSFRTPLPPASPHAEDGAGPVPCHSGGSAIVGCVGNAYPERLVRTASGPDSLGRRHRNMEFLRDRIIETGICKGMDLGRNFKRGTPVISHDFIVWRTDRARGVDIASGYDDVNTTLKLTWQVFGPDRSYGFPYYSKYPPVDCSGVNP
jgi:hypothetical protein